MPSDRIPNTYRRRAMSAMALGLGGLAFGKAVLAQGRNYPSRPITFIVPWPAGSVSDVTMRALCQAASAQLGQAIVIENRAGMSGMMGVKALASSRPDGYTIGQIPLSVTRFSQLGTIDVDPRKDFDYIARVSGLAFGIAVQADSPWDTLEAFLDAAKAEPGKLTYASPGMGNQTHIGMELLTRETGVDLLHVPFKGGSEATQALLGGHVDAVADSSTWAPFVQSGRLRLLATWGEQRLDQFPDVPTLKELGYGVVMSAPGGVAAPAGLPADVWQRLREAFRIAAQGPAHAEALKKYNMRVMYQDADAYRAFIETTYQEETRIIDLLNLRELLK